MKSGVWQRRALFLLLAADSLNLIWKLANWHETFSDIDWWRIVLQLTIQFATMGFLLFLYLRLKNAPKEQPVVTRTMKSASLRSMRIIHVILLAAIVGYAYMAEIMLRPTEVAPAIFVEGFSIMAVAEVVITFAVRRKLLRSALEGLQRDAGDAKALGQWRKANLFSMVMAVSVSLYGLALRFIGSSRQVAAPFFVAAVILMLLWRPYLDEGISGTNISPAPLG
jgi:F0F1-type ATP synthase membrane subunit c/vacuolar-type H+-ATPase subunit K